MKKILIIFTAGLLLFILSCGLNDPLGTAPPLTPNSITHNFTDGALEDDPDIFTIFSETTKAEANLQFGPWGCDWSDPDIPTGIMETENSSAKEGNICWSLRWNPNSASEGNDYWGWSEVSSSTFNLSDWSNGYLVFWAKGDATTSTITAGDDNLSVTLSSYGYNYDSTWNQIIIPVADIGYADIANVDIPLAISHPGPCDTNTGKFYIDQIRFVKTTNDLTNN